MVIDDIWQWLMVVGGGMVVVDAVLDVFVLDVVGGG